MNKDAFALQISIQKVHPLLICVEEEVHGSRPVSITLMIQWKVTGVSQ